MKRQPIRQNVPPRVPVDRPETGKDALTKESEERLAFTIRAAWARCGVVVVTRVESWNIGAKHRGYAVRSNLRNGLPPTTGAV